MSDLDLVEHAVHGGDEGDGDEADDDPITMMMTGSNSAVSLSILYFSSPS